jgi:hypothetical protein
LNVFDVKSTIDLTWNKFNSFPRFKISPLQRHPKTGLRSAELIMTGGADTPLEFYSISRLGLKIKSGVQEDLKDVKIAVTGYEQTEQF